MVCDEAHKLRSPKIKTSLSIFRMKVPHLMLLTATLMINKPADLYGLLSQIWKENWAKLVEKEDDKNAKGDGQNGDSESEQVERAVPGLEDYKAVSGQFHEITVDNLEPFVHLLNPRGFLRLAQRSDEPQMDALTASFVLPPIMVLISELYEPRDV